MSNEPQFSKKEINIEYRILSYEIAMQKQRMISIFLTLFNFMQIL